MKRTFTCLLAGLALGSVTAQVILDVCIVLMVLIFFYTLIKKNSRVQALRGFLPIGIEWAFLGYFIIAIISISLDSLSPKPWIGLRRLDWIAHLYLMIWAFSFVTIDLRKWYRFFCFAFLLPNIYALWCAWRGVEPLSATFDTRVVGLVHSATYHAHGNAVLLIFFGTLFGFLFRKLSSRERTFGFFCLVIMFLSVFLTMTRGIWFSVAVSLLFVLAAFNIRWLAWGAVLMTSAFCLCFQFSTAFQERIIGALMVQTGVDIRQNLMKANLLMIKDHPFFGVGYWDQYRQIKEYWPRLGLPVDYFMSHAHNEYINTLATMGMFGLIFYLAFCGYFFIETVRLYRKARAIDIQVLLLACLASQIEFHLACLTDVTFEYFKIRILILLVWALVVMIKRRYFQATEPTPNAST